MTGYAFAAYACYVAAEDKTRRFFYNDKCVVELTAKPYEKIQSRHIKIISTNKYCPFISGGMSIQDFLETLYYGHDVFGLSPSFPTKGKKLFELREQRIWNCHEEE